MDVTGDRRKVRCCKEQYCIGTWNVRSMNQGKLEVVKQKMARVHVSILGISELRWTGMGEFNLDDHYIYYSGQESFRRNGVAIMVNKRVQNAVLGCNLKNDKTLSIAPNAIYCSLSIFFFFFVFSLFFVHSFIDIYFTYLTIQLFKCAVQWFLVQTWFLIAK